MLTRDAALVLLHEHLPDENTRRHCLASEAVLRALAVRLGHDEATQDVWGLAGLLHDLDYALIADDHGAHGVRTLELLPDDALPDDALTAIRAHACEMNECAPPSTQFDFAVRCGETVTGLITAAALMRPTRLEGVSAKSLKKKMKDKAFARSVSRETIRECENLGLELGEFLLLAAEAMRERADELGLAVKERD